MDLSIIYVNWNSLAYLRESVASVYEYTHGISLEIVVVDNASPEGDVDVLREQFPEITLIKSPENLGFAGANNLGFRRSKGDYVFFFNPDTKLIAATINIILEHLKVLPDAGIVGCKLLNTDLSVQLTSIQKFPTILNQVVDAEYLMLRWPHSRFWGIAPLFSDNVKPLKVEVIPGACMLLRREVFAEVGMFSEDYFMYGEDIDLNYKLKRAGYTNYYVGETAVVHHGGRSSSQQKLGQWATIMRYRAMVCYFRKTRGRFYEVLYRLAIGVAAAGRLALLAMMFPLGNVVWDKESLRISATKWRAVLKWALGGQNPAIQNR
jgi:N-acetylglucosaminyl-diphospho-decaprenol L-rhamnosyltransferase